MKRSLIFIVFFLPILFLSCKDNSEKKQFTKNIENIETQVNFKELEIDFRKWWTYHSNNISLSSNFIGLNEKSEEIDKKYFLKLLTSGHFIPLKLQSTDGMEHYQLYQLNSIADKSIGNTIKNTSMTHLKHFEMEGTTFPKFDFTDIEGNHYTNESIKGKTTLIKTWFINCKACVEEFPELNDLVNTHKGNSDILFLSLALDSKSDLEAFLKTKMFKYAVIPNQKEFIAKELALQIYPTHLVIDEDGTILKVVNKATEMIFHLDYEKQSKENITPPPTPM